MAAHGIPYSMAGPMASRRDSAASVVLDPNMLSPNHQQQNQTKLISKLAFLFPGETLGYTLLISLVDFTCNCKHDTKVVKVQKGNKPKAHTYVSFFSTIFTFVYLVLTIFEYL